MLVALSGRDEMHENFEKIMSAVDAATAGMSEEQLRAHPPGKWSSAEVLEHLALTFGSTAKGFRKRITEGPQGGSPTLKQRLGDVLVLELGLFPFKRKSPTQVAPKGEIGGAEALALLKKNLVEMDNAFAEFGAKHGKTGCVADHPILGPLTYEQWPKFHLNHTRHHMKQIRLLRVLESRTESGSTTQNHG